MECTANSGKLLRGRNIIIYSLIFFSSRSELRKICYESGFVVICSRAIAPFAFLAYQFSRYGGCLQYNLINNYFIVARKNKTELFFFQLTIPGETLGGTVGGAPKNHKKVLLA